MQTPINTEQENLEITRRYKEMLRNTYRSIDQEEKVLIRKAFDLALDAHKDQRRKTGEPYIFHPIEVARIVADEIGLGATSIAAALMHDVVEDSDDYNLDDIESRFGKKIARIIDGLTKISNLGGQELSIQSENYRKLLLTLSEDVRVILIKIADRLHNMRTLGSMPEHKQLKIASETAFIYAPLAHRMGLYNIKTELEDLSLKYNEPEAYLEIEQKLTETKQEREEYIQNFTSAISSKLEKENINYSIKGRPKSIFSIRRKMKAQNVSFEEVYDKFAIRIIYKSDLEGEKFLAWKVYSIVTDIFTPNTNRLRDWISQPKSTGYESLHITVMGMKGKWVEVQIRSERMNEIAEKGIAAHYKYKEGSAGNEENNTERWIAQVREMLEQQSSQDTIEFIDNFKLNLYNKEIYVFTPNGDLKSLPRGATSLDFAYAVHSKVGDTCLGAKINGKLVPLSQELQSGDQVEIITSEHQKPKVDWLDFVVTSRAKSKIKSALNAEKKSLSEDGKEILIRKLRHLKITYNEKLAHEMANFLDFGTTQEMLIQIASGNVSNKEIKRFAERNTGVYGFLKRFRPKPGVKKPDAAKQEKEKYDSLVFGPEEERLDYTFANCCKPIPGDKVFGFLSINQGIKVHKSDCPNAINMRANYDYRVMKAKWTNSNNKTFSTTILLEGIDSLGLINSITDVISKNLNINMKSLNISSDDGIFRGRIAVEVNGKEQLQNIMQNLKKIEGIKNVKRTNL